MGAPVRESEDSKRPKDAPLKSVTVRKASSKSQPLIEEPSDAASLQPWRRSTRRGPFEGDVTVVELRPPLVPKPDRVPEPAAPVTRFASVRLAGGVLAAATVAGVAGYLWGFGLSTRPPQPAVFDEARIPSAPPPAAAPGAPAAVSNAGPAPPPAPSSSDRADVLPAPPAGSPAAVRSAGISSPVEPVERAGHVHPPPALTPQDRQRALDFLKKGEEMFAAGNVGAARLFYERAADAGLAEGALALAATFDPDELARRQVLGGVQPDRAAARRWYGRALELGASEAENRLDRLGARTP
jgi:hypothetical protein